MITISGAENRNLDLLWANVERYRKAMQASGEWEARRSAQAVAWMHDLIADRLLAATRNHPQVVAAWPGIEASVRTGKMLATRAADKILALMGIDATI